MEFINFKLEIVDKEICILSFNSQDTNINTVNKILFVKSLFFEKKPGFEF